MAYSISRPDLPVLTSLRFFAAAVVLVNHLDPKRLPFSSEVFLGWFEAGYNAVTFFFVLSGFILVYVYSGVRECDGLNVGYRKFISARLIRIGPAYYLGLILTLLPFLYGFQVARIVPPDRFVPAIILVPTLLQSWYPPVSFSWNGPAWSLSVELFFYALFPLLLQATNRMSRTQLLLFASCIVVAIAALRGAYIDTLNVDDSDSWRYFSLYFPILHLSSFVFGMALGRIYLFGQSASNRMHNLMFLFGALILFLLFGARSSLPFWVLTDATLVPLYGLLILGGANLDSHLRTVFSAPVLVLLGESSYSIYILHSGIIFWLHWILQKLFTLRLDVTIDFLICIGFVIGISILSFKYFERPLRRWLLIRIARI